MSEAQRAKWGVIPDARGIHQKDYDLVSEVYFWADEGTLRGRLNQFIQVCLHELRHAIKHGTGKPDDTHAIHGTSGDIRGSFKDIRMADYDPRKRNLEKQLSLWAKVLQLTRQLFMAPTTLLHPVQDGRSYVSQPYGVKNAVYKITGRHIGTDYAIPVGTPLVAPWDGRVTTIGNHPALGNYCHFTYTREGKTWEERWCHLQSVPPRRGFRRGETVAHSGNTGMSSGPHLHREVWPDAVRIDLINKTNWQDLTVDPELIK